MSSHSIVILKHKKEVNMIIRLDLSTMQEAGFTVREAFYILKDVRALDNNQQFDYVENKLDETQDDRFETLIGLMVVTL